MTIAQLTHPSPVPDPPATSTPDLAALIAEIGLIVRQGVWKAFPHLHQLRASALYGAGAEPMEVAQGVRLMEQVLKQALDRWHLEEARDAEALAALLELGHRGRRVLNGSHGSRTVAGRVFNDVGYDQFARHYERPLIERFADFLTRSDDAAPDAPTGVTELTFADLEFAATVLHRRLEQEFCPDLVLAMSGQGSMAASLLMRYNVRDIPVATAITFPRHEVPLNAERAFAVAARETGLPHLLTTRFSIYLPAVVRHLRPRCRVALVDDRIEAGETHLQARTLLTSLGCEVASAALVADADAPLPGLIVGREMSGPFQMPWGSSPY